MVGSAQVTRRAVLGAGVAALVSGCSRNAASPATPTLAGGPAPSPISLTPGSRFTPGATVRPGGPGAECRTSDGKAPWLAVESRSRAGRLEDWVLRTDAVPTPVRVKVLLPASYDSAATRRYPVLYLLHGSNGDAGAWLNARLPELVGNRDVILVLPDGGTEGWYVDWASASPAVRWESFHIHTLRPAIEGVYRTFGTGAARGVAGFSMGGFGAMHYAQAYPELFAAATSISGAVSLREPRDFAAMDHQSLPGKPADAIFGGAGAEDRVARVDPVEHVANLRGRRVRLYSGDGTTSSGTDQAEAGFREAASAFVAAAGAAGVDAQASVLPGGHSFDVWTPALARDFPGLLAALTPAR